MENQVITPSTPVNEKRHSLWVDQLSVIASQVLIYAFLLFMATIVILPFYWMILTALKSTAELDLIPPSYFITQGIEWSSLAQAFPDWNLGAWIGSVGIPQNFVDAMNAANFGAYFKNSLLVGALTTIGTLVTTILTAYAFARLEFKGRDTIFMLLLATMMVPGEMMIITNYVTVAKLGWLNSYQALILPFMVSTFYIFFLRNTIKQVPVELYKAAKVDGFSDFQFMTRIVVPIVRPTLITITILGLLGAWNAYVWPNLVTNDDLLRLVTNGLKTAFTSSQGRVAQNLQMAAATFVTLPILVVFLTLKKYIVRGVSRSGIKG